MGSSTETPPPPQDSGRKFLVFNEIQCVLPSKFVILPELPADSCWIRSYVRFGGSFCSFLAEKDTMKLLCAKRGLFSANAGHFFEDGGDCGIGLFCPTPHHVRIPVRGSPGRRRDGTRGFCGRGQMTGAPLLARSFGDSDDAVHSWDGEHLHFAARPVDFYGFNGGGRAEAEVGARIVA